MDYEKKYKEALERMKSWARGEHPECFTEAQKAAEFIFPELAESEDDRIKKALIRFHKSSIDIDGIKGADIIAWLEKQGKEECALKSSKDEDVRKFMQYIEKEAKAYEFNLPNRSYDIYAFAKDILVWLEKQGEQKSIDKVEPKFKDGDYIKHNKANIICKVISVNSGSYYVENIETGNRIELFSAEQNFHLWSIEDAKDGDVLTVNRKPFICYHTDEYKGNYCCIDDNGCFRTNIRFSFEGNCILPATKEQRDILFQKMREAGYEWLEDKKELRKIEKQAPQEQDGFEAELNALLKKYEHLPKHELADSLEFYLNVVKEQYKTPFDKKRLEEVAKPETLEEKVEHWQRMRDIAMEKIKGTFKEEDNPEIKAIKEYMENLKKRIEDNQLGCIVQRLDRIIELLQSAILILPKETYMPPIIYKRPLDPDPNVLGGWTTTASTFGSDYDIDTDKIK